MRKFKNEKVRYLVVLTCITYLYVWLESTREDTVKPRTNCQPKSGFSSPRLKTRLFWNSLNSHGSHEILFLLN